jgi:DNA-binding IclR family transcriptional regulator
MAVKIENNRRYEVNNVAEAFTIIATMLDANDCLGLTQLSDCTHFSKNKTFRLLSTLEQCGIVEKDQQCNYKMGVATIGIARKIMAKASLLDRARPYMEGLVKLVNEAVYFAYYSAGEAVLVDYADCRQPIKATSFVGKAIKLPDCATLVKRDKSVAKIGDIIVDAGGMDLEITTVCMPFVDDKGVETGALVVLAPSYRMPMDRIKAEMVPALREVMQRQPMLLPKITNDIFLPFAQPVERIFGVHPALVTELPPKMDTVKRVVCR